MQKLSLVDETFDFNLTTEYNLSILVSLDGFSFSILDSIQNKVVCLYHQDIFTNEPDFHLKKIKSGFEEVNLLDLPYKKVRIYYSAPGKTTIVPAAAFRPELAADFYRLTFETDRNSSLMHRYIPSLDICALYEINHSLCSFLKEKYPEIEIQHDLILSGYDLQQGKPLLKIKILRKQLEIIASTGKGISFYNSFYYEGENDMLYYILGTVKQINEQPDKVILDGMVNKHADIYHRLRQYFEQVHVADNNRNIHYSYLIERLPDARFTSFFNSFLCE